MFDKASLKLTQYIQRNQAEMSQDEFDIINYGLNILLYETTVFLIVLGISGIFHIFLYTLAAFLANCLTRFFAGGVHANQRIFCFSSFCLIIFGNVALSQYLAGTIANPSSFLWLFIPMLILNFLFAPADTENKPVLNKTLVWINKIEACLIVALMFGLSIFFLKQGYTTFYFIIIVQSTLNACFLTPLAYRLFNCHYSNKAVRL